MGLDGTVILDIVMDCFREAEATATASLEPEMHGFLRGDEGGLRESNEEDSDATRGGVLRYSCDNLAATNGSLGALSSSVKRPMSLRGGGGADNPWKEFSPDLSVSVLNTVAPTDSVGSRTFFFICV
jgi:hypothetical protein